MKFVRTLRERPESGQDCLVVFKAHRLLYHSTLGLRVIKKKKKVERAMQRASDAGRCCSRLFSCEAVQGRLNTSPPRNRFTCLRSRVAPRRRPPAHRAAAGCSPVKRFRGGLVFKAHRPFYRSTLGLRVIKKQKNLAERRGAPRKVGGEQKHLRTQHRQVPCGHPHLGMCY